MKTFAHGLICAVALLGPAGAAHAALPTPVITHADPQPVYPGAALDGNGRIALTLIGHDLGPKDGDNGHPAGYTGGYQHIFIRGVSADNKAGAWVECRPDDCVPYGSTGVYADTIHLGIAPHVLSQPGSHLQIKLWVSRGADPGNAPEEARAEASGWSPIYTVDVARPGQAAPAPVILKFEPSEIGIDGASTNWYVRLIGTGLCTAAAKVVFNGDLASAVAINPARCGTVGAGYPSGTALYDIEIPAALRKPGAVTVRMHSDAGDSATETVTIRQVFHKLNGPAVNIPKVAQPAPATTQPATPFRKKP
jgi:hypothetical protein